MTKPFPYRVYSKKKACPQGSKLFSLTHCILADSSTVMYWRSPFVILGMSVYFVPFILFFDRKSCYQSTVDADQIPHDVVSDLGLRCLPMTLL